MRKSRFSEECIIGNLKEHQAGLGENELCRKGNPLCTRCSIKPPPYC